MKSRDAEPTDWLLFEHMLNELGHRYVAGMDEAGCGPLAGPVVAACVLLPLDRPIEGVNDSKKLGALRREALAERIRDAALSVGVGYAFQEEIDEINISNATLLAMQRAAEFCLLGHPLDYILVDARPLLTESVKALPLIKGDTLSYSIAAASIIAKTERDAYMRRLDEAFPQYGFAKHMGYPTPEHFHALDEHGPTTHHRRTFLTKWTARAKQTSSADQSAKG